MSAQALPTTQRIVYQPDPQSPALALGEGRVPVPGPHQCLIQVKAASPVLGELTWEKFFPALFPQDMNRLEKIPCTEGSGVVITGPANGNFKPGDEVFYRTLASDPGSLRKFTVVNEAQLALKPKLMDWIKASATSLSSLTAYQGLFDHGGIDRAALWGDEQARSKNSNKRVLVTGASGNVGMWIVQLAALSGCQVIGVSGPSKAQDVLNLGASEVIDYTKQTIPSWVGHDESKLCHLALDCTGGDSLQGCFYAVKPGGILLSACGNPEDQRPSDLADKKFEKCTFFLMPHSNTKDLTEVAKIIDAGKVTIWMDSVYEYDEFEKAFNKVSGKTRGKVVIKVDC